MLKKSYGLLAGFQVHSNWRERALAYQAIMQPMFMIVASVVIGLVLLVSLYRWLVIWSPIHHIFSAEAMWIVLFGVGGWSATRAPVQQLSRYLIVVIVAIAAFLATLLGASLLQVDLQSTRQMSWPYSIVSLIPLLIVIAGTGLLVVHHCHQSIFCRILTSWRLKATFLGTVAGVLLMFQQLLGAEFAGASLLSIPFEPLLHVQWLVTVIFVQTIAEELIFRAVIFDYLHKVRGVSLWWALLTTLVFNVLVYLPLMPLNLPPEQITIYLLQPVMLAITCSVLWTWERGINACLACNITFRLLLMLL